MEHMPHNPGQGKDRAMERDLDREAEEFMKQIGADEVEGVEVVKRGVQERKIEGQRGRVDASALANKIDTLQKTIDALEQKAVKEEMGGQEGAARATKMRIQYEKVKLEQSKRDLMGMTGGHA